jgi:hypothetical protein
MHIRFALVCEGSSDRGLVHHLESLCRRAGAVEVEGIAPDLGRLPQPVGKTVAEQVEAMLGLEPNLDLIFIHRDADDHDDASVRAIIDRGITSLGTQVPPHVKVIPVHELEAWLLLDEREIRAVAGSPRGKQDLELPSPHDLEATKNPKERLERALVLACGLSGHRLVRFKRRLPQLRSVLLQRLDIDGPVRELSAWRKLLADIATAYDAIVLQPRRS